MKPKNGYIYLKPLGRDVQKLNSGLELQKKEKRYIFKVGQILASEEEDLKVGDYVLYRKMHGMDFEQNVLIHRAWIYLQGEKDILQKLKTE